MAIIAQTHQDAWQASLQRSTTVHDSEESIISLANA